MSISQSYLFYDLETSGLSPYFDQVYEFAAIRTDLHFQEIERHSFLVRPTIDIIPTPDAVITHRLSIQALMKEGMAENQAIQKIHEILNQPGTISLGYNTLSFDDEFLRFNFFRHLRTSYTHQFANGCRRMDLFPLLLFYYHFRFDSLTWPPRDEEGGISLKLDKISQANHLASGAAHRAMVDVEASLALAKRLAQDEKMWSYLLGFFNKATEGERLAKLPYVLIDHIAYPHALLLDAKLGYKQDFQAPVLCLGQHWHYKNQTIWLRLDDERLLAGDSEVIPSLWPIKKKSAEPPFMLPPESRFIRFAPERQEVANQVFHLFQEKPQFFKAIQAALLDYTYPVYPETDVDARLYQRSFFSPEDTVQMRHFHAQQPEVQAHFYKQFKDLDLQSMALRYLGRFYPASLDFAAQADFRLYLERVEGKDLTVFPSILGYKQEAKTTCEAALLRIEEVRKEKILDEEQLAVLEDLERYLLVWRQQKK